MFHTHLRIIDQYQQFWELFAIQEGDRIFQSILFTHCKDAPFDYNSSDYKKKECLEYNFFNALLNGQLPLFEKRAL